MSIDPHRGRGGRYVEDEHGNRVPVKTEEIPGAPVKKSAPAPAQQKSTKRSKS